MADVTDSMSELNALLMAKSVLNVGKIITSQQPFQRPIQKPIQERQWQAAPTAQVFHGEQ